ncbi:hypothetical protein HCH_01847 [Hahella chejuensis KCTC 2396]|uniref:Uncharacterized protein n=1 Tax=Hahella chejuensis (strain KCTC 2396) TaxID=349521 RepID=Q2SKY9_HAHCH|nr:hypothetical protein HCH_01847 [Hahella chejuensis KCTC 2396]
MAEINGSEASQKARQEALDKGREVMSVDDDGNIVIDKKDSDGVTRTTIVKRKVDS